MHPLMTISDCPTSCHLAPWFKDTVYRADWNGSVPYDHCGGVIMNVNSVLFTLESLFTMERADL